MIVELVGKQAVSVIDHRNLGAEPLHAARSFQSQQAAAEHHGVVAACLAGDQCIGVIEIAKGINAGEIGP